jgi:hypothetical protein
VSEDKNKNFRTLSTDDRSEKKLDFVKKSSKNLSKNNNTKTLRKTHTNNEKIS